MPSIHVYMNGINTRLVFEIRDGNKLELQTPKTMNYLVVQKINRQNKKKKTEKKY